MLRTTINNMLKLTLTGSLAIVCSAFANAQTTATLTPVPVMATLAPAPAATDASGAEFAPVREAMGRQDYTAARTALDQIRSTDPNNPSIAVYESIIERRQTQGQTIGTQSPLRTPRAGVTPAPTPVPTATPVPTPEPTPVPVATPAPEGVGSKVSGLMKNDMVKYGVAGVVAVLVIGLVLWFLKKRRLANQPEPEATAFSTGLGSVDDSFPPTVGLSGSPLSTDFSMPDNAYGEDNAPQPLGGSALSGSALGGAAMGTEMSNYTIPSFGDDEEEESAPRKAVMPPKPVEEDEGPVNLFDEEPASSSQTTLQSAETSPVPGSETATFDALGINFGAVGEDEPAPPKAGSFHDETTILEPEELPKPVNSTPTSNPSVAPGQVDLEDIFGSQPLPGAVPEEDTNSKTLSTFVSTPGAANPEESLEQPPAQNMREPEAPGSETQSLSFEELFGSADSSILSTPAAESTPVAEPAPAPAPSASDMSIEDALAATIGDMADQKPFDEQPTMLDPAATEEPASSESLDERSERMFNEQMEKARQAFGEKNWRQAVHFLSIASALHPEHEEARQMLKEARAEKRKSEESV